MRADVCLGVCVCVGRVRVLFVCVRLRESVSVRIPYATPKAVPATLIARESLECCPVRAGEDRKDQNLLTATGSWLRSVGETPSVRFRSIAITSPGMFPFHRPSKNSVSTRRPPQL